ncbi:MAG: formate dehydrogenase accessory protein FdhE [Acidobacteria bacterium]|nr:formate dehydrogenase accessory protein FdhE [Acidobacteriota bacterium]
MTPSAVWSRRRQRVARLRAERPHAAELLAFYDDVLALQEPLYAKAVKSRWLGAVEANDGRGPRLRLERLPGRPRERDFSRFVRALPASATEVLRALASRLASEPTAMSELLTAVLGRDSIDAVAARLDCDAAALEFFPRAFVQPVAEALATQAFRDSNGPSSGDWDNGVAGKDESASCPYCGALPVAAVLRDEPEIKGRRTLLCSLCLAEWTFPRTRCPACGEDRADKRPHHVSESWPHVRVEECGSCGTYIKAVDLREFGLAVPVVDELASVDLDLWAVEQGLSKAQTNLLGM